ncbi:hypothetical protein [Mammaliicoccus lentus]|uniref:hypothetical protein n=1 Tax=Mammaliicoccus lentus TaxID=42858 RepID=UPI002DB79897|nr:hypothetical protein [Mammaliicoccus lentus]MEB8091973.1 hypothetical protein [Mammaliicoccus lentus]
MYNQSIVSRFLSGTACLMLLLGVFANQTVEASGAGKPGAQTSVSTSNSNDSVIKVTAQKPQVAPVPKKNQPNRIITNFNGDT